MSYFSKYPKVGSRVQMATCKSTLNGWVGTVLRREKGPGYTELVRVRFDIANMGGEFSETYNLHINDLRPAPADEHFATILMRCEVARRWLNVHGMLAESENGKVKKRLARYAHENLNAVRLPESKENS